MAPDDRASPPRRALVECGLWLMVGFVGASGVAVGVLQLFDGELKPVPALMLILGGGLSAVVGWWRGRTAVDAADMDATVVSEASPLAHDFAAAQPEVSS